MDTLTVKRAVASQLQNIVALENRSFIAEDRFSRKTWRHLLGLANDRGTALTLIVMQQDLIVGSINVLLRQQGHTARIYSIAVDPAMRGRGIGGLLIRALQQHLPQKYTNLSLEVRTSNHAARALYERLGFAAKRPLPGYYPDGEDGVRYELARAALM